MKDNYDYYAMKFDHQDDKSDKPDCYHGVTGCVNCNNYKCKFAGGSIDLYMKNGNSCKNRDFPDEAEEELCNYINSQNH